jgi:signal transduction histidine kinase
MPRAIQSTFFEPLIHGLDVMLAKAERVMTGERANPDLDVVAVSHHRDLVNLPGVAEQVAAQCEDAAEARSVHLFVDVAPDALVIGDSVELHRVVEELVSSVLESTPNGSCVTISGTVVHGVVTLTFSSHHSSRQAAAPPPGLSFCPSEVGRILRAHGGRLEVSNRLGEGSRFEVRLPVG